MISWMYGVTTVPKRIASGLLQQTIESLVKGGFPNPVLFIDGLPLAETLAFSNLQVVCRTNSIRIYGNFHLGLSELFIRNPHADRYAMFQDDFVTYPNLREYLNQCEYPEKGYLNLYTFPENEKPEQGWYLSNQLGKGAVALVFNNEAVRQLLNSAHWINRPASAPKDHKRTWKYVDGGIVEALKQQGFKEYVHNPSLTQHTGKKSTLGNSRHATARTFKGESFNALHLIKSPTPITERTKARIGLVGYNILTDATKVVAEHADIYRWLVRPHHTLGMLSLPEDVDCMVCPVGHKVGDFLKTVDVVVYLESPCYENLIDECAAHGKQIVCIPTDYKFPHDEAGWKEFDNLVRSNSLNGAG